MRYRKYDKKGSIWKAILGGAIGCAIVVAICFGIVKVGESLENNTTEVQEETEAEAEVEIETESGTEVEVGE